MSTRAAVNRHLPPSKTGFALSKDVVAAAIPAIPVARQWIEEYNIGPLAATQPLIDVSQGVPGIPPPPSLLAALAHHASSPLSAKYGHIRGERSLRRSLLERMQRTYGPGADLRVEDLAISAGANLAFVSVVMSVCDPGEEVIIPVPWYFNQEQVLMMRGVRPVALRTRPEDGFVPQAKEAEKLVTQRTKAIALVSPNNPTGAIYPPALLARFALLCARHNIALILDETYRDFCPSSPHALFSQSLVPTLSESDASELRQELTKEEIEIASRWDWRKNLISLYSFSKSYAVPGHRLGAVVCGAELMQQVEKVLDCLQICPPRAIQLALAEQIPVLEPFVQEQAHTLAHRHAVLKSSLPSSWKLAAQGGFFAYLRHPFPSHSSYSVSQRLALELGVATLPGRFFQPEEGAEFWGSRERAREEDRWVRVGVANVDEDGVRGVGERLERAVSEWGWEVEK